MGWDTQALRPVAVKPVARAVALRPVALAVAMACGLSACGLVTDGGEGAESARGGLLARVVAQQVVYQAREATRRIAAQARCDALDWGPRYGRPGMSLVQEVRVRTADDQVTLALDVQVRWGAHDALWVEERARWRGEVEHVTAWERRGGAWRRGGAEVAGGEGYVQGVFRAFGALSAATADHPGGAPQVVQSADEGACAHDNPLRAWTSATHRRLRRIDIHTSDPPRRDGLATRRLVLSAERDAPGLSPDAQRWTITLTERYAVSATTAPSPWPTSPADVTTSASASAASGWPAVRALLIEALSGPPPSRSP